MRDFTPKENALIKFLAKYKEQDDIESLRFKNFLSIVIPEYVLVWDNESYNILDNIKLFIPDRNEDFVKGAFYELADFIFFLEELEAEKFIILRNANKGVSTNLFDTKYYYQKKQEIYKIKDNKNICEYKPYSTQLELQRLLNKYADCLILPLPILVEYVSNGCKSYEKLLLDEERERYEDSQKCTILSLEQTQESIKLNRIAVCITAIFSFISVVISLNQCSESKSVEVNNIQEIVSAIKEHKTVTIDSVNVLPADTFNVNIIQQKAKPAPKPQQEPLKQPLPNN